MAACIYDCAAHGGTQLRVWSHACAICRYAFAYAVICLSEWPQPTFIVSVGDNFYDTGVANASDPQFKESWIDVYLQVRACGALDYLYALPAACF